MIDCPGILFRFFEFLFRAKQIRQVASIKAAGHTVLVQSGAGVGSGFSDEKYAAAGAEIVETGKEMWERCDFVAKVKEIEPHEFDLPRENQLLYCCIHPAGHPEEVDALLKSKCIAITAEDSHRYGSPNCEAAGKQGALFGLESMLTINGGKGKYVGGFAGAPSPSWTSTWACCVSWARSTRATSTPCSAPRRPSRRYCPRWTW